MTFKSQLHIEERFCEWLCPRPHFLHSTFKQSTNLKLHGCTLHDRHFFWPFMLIGYVQSLTLTFVGNKHIICRRTNSCTQSYPISSGSREDLWVEKQSKELCMETGHFGFKEQLKIYLDIHYKWWWTCGLLLMTVY